MPGEATLRGTGGSQSYTGAREPHAQESRSISTTDRGVRLSTRLIRAHAHANVRRHLAKSMARIVILLLSDAFAIILLRSALRAFRRTVAMRGLPLGPWEGLFIAGS